MRNIISVLVDCDEDVYVRVRQSGTFAKGKFQREIIQTDKGDKAVLEVFGKSLEAGNWDVIKPDCVEMFISDIQEIRIVRP